jgi:hypothetical protein
MTQDNSIKDLLQADIQKNLLIANEHKTVGMFTVQTVNSSMQEAFLQPNPKQLFLSLWFENECGCLFADANIGKSILDVQIGTKLATNDIVVIFDFELSAKQFQIRYTDDNGKMYQFPEKLKIARIDPNIYTAEDDFESAVINDIRKIIISENAKIVIIDNLTWLCNASEKGDAAGKLMKRLIGLKREFDISMLVIAHTPKRPLTNPITQNDLAGSKKLMNFFDSVFALGKSVRGENERYIKQIKARNCAIEYGGDNVICCRLEKGTDGFTRIIKYGYSPEHEHLKEITDRNAYNKDEAKRLSGQGMSLRDIADKLGVSHVTISNWLTKS